MSFLREIKRRKVFQIAAVYAVVAWLLMQIAATIQEPLRLPDWFATAIIVALAIGFPITLVVSWAFNVTPDGLVRDSGDTEAGGNDGRRLEYALIGLLAVAVAWLLYRDLDSVRDTVPVATAGVGDEMDAAVDSTTLTNSVAVLLCDNFSTDPENAFFAQGLHEEILNQLFKLRNLNVIARTSVLQYSVEGTARPPIPRIAAELGVTSVMECSVAYGDGRIVISAQLIDGRSGVHLWSERYNRPFADVFGIQADIAMNVANALAVEFSATEQQAIARAPTQSREAYALYLSALAKSGSFTVQDMDEGLREVEEAIAIAPDFAQAWALKATYLGNRYAVRPSASRAIERESRLQAVQRAIELDPTLPVGHVALASVLSSIGDFIGAEASFRRAIELNPSMVFQGQSPWVQRIAVADFAGAQTLLDAVRRHDPLNRNAQAFQVLSFGLLGDLARAEREYSRLQQLNAAGLAIWFITVERMGANGNAGFDGIDNLWLLDTLDVPVGGRKLLDSPEQGLQTLQRQYEMESAQGNMSDVRVVQFAQWAAYWGDAEWAFAIVEPIIRADALNIYHLWQANTRAVRQLPGFRSLLVDMGVVDAWNEFGWPDVCRPLPGEDFVCD